jgi:hypothetical protein
MDLRRLGAGEWILGAAGLALLVSLFCPWYGTPGPGASDLSAWEALAVTDVLLALIAAFALLVPVVTAAQRVPAIPLALDALVFSAGLLGSVLVLIRALALPDGAEGREWALWLGLAATIAILVGAALAMRDERLSTPGRPTDAGGVPAPPSELPDPIPAPRP